MSNRNFDPRPQTRPDGSTYMCAGDAGFSTPGYTCDFCCKQRGSVIQHCSLGIEERSIPDHNRPPSPNANSKCKYI